MPTPLISIPQPCAQPWATMSPTAAGRHCAACATEVVDFTRLSEAEILAFLAQHSGRAVCANAYVTQVVPPPASRWRRWAVAALALLGWPAVSSCATRPPQPPPAAASGTASVAAQPQRVIIRGRVLDGANGPGVAGAYLFINDTQYGTTTDQDGRFELVLKPGWAPVRAGQLTLRVQAGHFTFKAKEVPVKIAAGPPVELLITMESVEGRGHIMGKVKMQKPPVAPPGG